MNKELFLILSGCILAFTIVAMCTGPIISGLIDANWWKYINIKRYSDEISQLKGATKEELKGAKHFKHLYSRFKALYGLEYSALIIDLVFAFVCTLLGLLHVFDQGKYFEKYTGLIGLATGAIGFIMTLVYICYNGYIFTKDEEATLGFDFLQMISDPDPDDLDDLRIFFKVDKDRAFAEWDNSKQQYKCKYFDKDSIFGAQMTTYSSLGKKQYNYQKDKVEDLNDDSDSIEYFHCQQKNPFHCNGQDKGYIMPDSGQQYTFSVDKKCQKLYYKDSSYDSISNKYVFDNWLTNIIFTCLIIACEIGLALFGFLLFNENKGSI